MRKRHWAALIAATALVLPACGGDDAATDTSPDTATTAPAAAPTTAPEEEPTTTSAPATTVAESTTTSAAPVTTDPPPTTEPPPTTLAPTTTVRPAGEGFLDLVDAGALDVSVESPGGGVSGEILDVTLANPTDEELVFLVPCGLFFAPEGELQRMMVVQSVEVTLDPGGSTVVTPYVMCIDSGLSAPDGGDVYGIGAMATDELLALAECVCERDLAAELDPMMGDLSLQMAVWAASDGELPDIEGDLAEVEGALGDVLGGGLGFDPEDLEELTGMPGFDLEAVLEQAMQFMNEYNTNASTWLEECGIVLEG
jgi:hypothetical protein